MNSVLKIVLAAAVPLAVAACGGGAYVSASAEAPVYYDGFYDGHYGPFYDGYWGDDNSFYYSGRRGRPFIRDEANHFRHDAAAGFSSFHHAHGGPHTGHPHEPAHS